MRKKVFFAGLLACMILGGSIIFTGCSAQNYIKELKSYKFWANSFEQSIPQTSIFNMVDDHMSNENGKTKKVAVIGFDGARADMLVNLLDSKAIEDNKDIYSGVTTTPVYSAVNALVEDGAKVYHAYTGGAKGEKSEQETSTIWGWAAMLTGKWGYQSGTCSVNGGAYKYMKGHTPQINLESPTFTRKYAEKGLKTSFSASWDTHFDETYLKEIDYLDNNKNVDMLYNNFNNDAEMHEYLKKAVTVGSEEERDIIFAIYENPDNNGHSTGFGNDNYRYTNSIVKSDNYAYEIIDMIKNRSTYDSEDWLIIMSSDHGGKGRGHGKQIVECRSIYIISNKPEITEKYYGKNYDGFKEN